MTTSATPKPPLSRAYTLKASKIPNYFRVLFDNPIPEVFDTAFLAKSGFRYAIDRAFIDIIKGLGFLTKVDVPTQRYRDFRSPRQAGAVLRQGLAEAYAGLLAVLPEAAACPERQIMETVSRYFEGEINDMAAGGIAATFLALTQYAAGLDNGSAIAGAAQGPAVAAIPASEPTPSAPVASGPAAMAASKPVAMPRTAPEPATAPKPVAAPEPVAAVSLAVAGAPAPEPVAQAEAASLHTAPAAVAQTEAVAPTYAQTASLPVAPLSAVAEVPAPATARAAVPETAPPETTPAASPDAPPQAGPTPAETASAAVPTEAAASATPSASLAQAAPAPTPGATPPEPVAAVSPEADNAASPVADTDTADKADSASGIAIAAFSAEAQGQAQDMPQRPVIHITLPASTDEAVYDAIFASLKRHMLSPGDNA